MIAAALSFYQRPVAAKGSSSHCGKITSVKTSELVGQDEVVNVRIPRFELSSNVDLETSMKNFGLDVIFKKSNVDFSLMAKNENIFMTSMPHR